MSFVGEFPAEGWQPYLEEQQRLLAMRYQCPAAPSPVPMTPEDDLFASYFAESCAGDTLVTQLQRDWHRFVTLGQGVELRSPTPSPIATPCPPPVEAPRPLAPQPLLLTQPLGWPMTRNASPVRFLPYEPPPPPPPQPRLAPRYRPRRRSRQVTRLMSRLRLQNEPLRNTSQGRSILALADRVWWHAPSGFAVTQYSLEENIWLANDVANYLTWLGRNILVHRSTTHRLVCVENIDALNAVLSENSRSPIVPRGTPCDWAVRWNGHSLRGRGLPAFLREGYSRPLSLSRCGRLDTSSPNSSHARLDDDDTSAARAPAQAPDPDAKDAGQAAEPIHAHASSD